MSFMPGIPLPEERNPFAGKGLAITVALLLAGGQPRSLGELAKAAEASRPHVTKVINALRRQSLIAGDIEQGREGQIVPTRALLDETAWNWPVPIAYVIGRPPSTDSIPCGGGPALGELAPAAWDPPPRAYVRNNDQARDLLADVGGQLIEAGGAADWEIAVVDFPFGRGVLPPIIASLELGSTPRGREVFARHRRELAGGWPSDGG